MGSITREAGVLGGIRCTNFWVTFFFVLCFLCISIGKGRWHHWMVCGRQMGLMILGGGDWGIGLVFLDNIPLLGNRMNGLV